MAPSGRPPKARRPPSQLGRRRNATSAGRCPSTELRSNLAHCSHIGCGRVTVCDTLVRLDSKQSLSAKPATVVCLVLSAREPIRRRPTKIQPSQRAPGSELETAPSPAGPREDLRAAIKLRNPPLLHARPARSRESGCRQDAVQQLAQHHPGS